MPEAGSLSPPRPPAAEGRMPWPSLPARGESHLLRATESMLEPSMAVLALWLLVGWLDGGMTPAWLLVSVLAFALSFPGRPRQHARPRAAGAGIVADWLWVAGLLWLAGLLTGQLAMFSSRVLLHWLWLAPTLQVLAHLALRAVAPYVVKLQGPPLRAVVVGLNAQGRALAERLSRAGLAGVTLVACFDDRAEARGCGFGPLVRQGGLDEVAAFAKNQRVHHVYLSLPMASQPRIKALLDALKDTTASVHFVPDLFVTDLIQGRYDTVCGLPVISVCDTPFRGPAGLIKRAFDLVLASSILLLLAPLMLAIGLAVRLTSPGPAIFRQRRYGLDGQEIIVYKFRSMTVAEDGPAIRQARRGDARVTRLGAFLRRTSLDELPQFINVLQGRMSVVGPRPHAVAHNEFYRSQIKSYMVRHKVRPGITGWAQVNGLRGETESLEKMQERVRLDLDYLRHWSLRLDLVIIGRTIGLVFRDTAAY